MQPIANRRLDSDAEKCGRNRMVDLLERTPIPTDQLLENIGLFIESKHLARIL
jgi:hypothetical protein